jgi:hypothetical protein
VEINSLFYQICEGHVEWCFVMFANLTIQLDDFLILLFVKDAKKRYCIIVNIKHIFLKLHTIVNAYVFLIESNTLQLLFYFF